MEFSRPEYWSGQPIPSPADLPDPGVEPGSAALQADPLPPELSGRPTVGLCRSRFSCSSAYLLISNSCFIPPHSPSPLVTMFVFYVCESVSAS